MGRLQGSGGSGELLQGAQAASRCSHRDIVGQAARRARAPPLPPHKPDFLGICPPLRGHPLRCAGGGRNKSGSNVRTQRLQVASSIRLCRVAGGAAPDSVPRPVGDSRTDQTTCAGPQRRCPAGSCGGIVPAWSGIGGGWISWRAPPPEDGKCVRSGTTGACSLDVPSQYAHGTNKPAKTRFARKHTTPVRFPS